MKTNWTILFFCFFAFLTGCKEDTESISLSTEEITIQQTGGTKTLEINTNSHWTAYSNVDWIHISPTEGEGTTTLTIVVDSSSNKEVTVGHVYFWTGKRFDTTDDYESATLNGTPQQLAYGKMISLNVKREKKIYNLNVPEIIDLGLSVKWGSFNLGANSIEGIGNYYGWGELEPKENYVRSNYSVNVSAATEDGHLIPAYDAATVMLGPDWRLPTWAEMAELSNSLKWKNSTINEVSGVTGTAANGNTIFFPDTGIRIGTELQAPTWGYYLTSKRYGAPTMIFVTATDREGSNNEGYEGRCIRPVYVGK